MKELPVTELPATLQEELQLLHGGQFKRKTLHISNHGLSTLFMEHNFPDILIVEMSQDAYLLGGDFLSTLTVGDNQGACYRSKGWVETGSVFRHVYHSVGGLMVKKGWKITFTKNGATLALSLKQNAGWRM